MPVTLAFDVYGTLIDTHGVVIKLQDYIGDRAAQFSQVWREKQLEYSFRRGLMRRYATFAVCTRDALDYTSDYLDAGLDDTQKQTLLSLYRELPAFDDVEDSLLELRSAGHQLHAFSNGTADAVNTLLESAGIIGLFDSVVSVDDKQTFKPNPDVYQHFLDSAGSKPAETWLISGNPFDVIGAASHGWQSAWVRRSEKAVFDPWGIDPTITIASLRELGAGIVSSGR